MGSALPAVVVALVAAVVPIVVPAAVSAAPAEQEAFGQLAQLAGLDGCVSETGTSGACVDGVALVDGVGTAISPQGDTVYSASLASDAVVVFDRDPSDGALEQLGGTDGCVSETGTDGACADVIALDGPRGVAVSPDGQNVYVAATQSDALVVFDRDLATGVLDQKTGTDGCVSESGTGGACADGTALDNVWNVTVSPDGKNVYAASNSSDAVVVFDRDQTTGALTQQAGTAGCISHMGTGGLCVDSVAPIDGAVTVVVSPDGANVYVTAYNSSSVVAFDRDQTTGALTQQVGPTACVTETGSLGACTDGVALVNSQGLAVSPDGESVYVASDGSQGVAVLDRDPATGVLTPASGPGDCVTETGSAGACTDGVGLQRPRAVTVSPDGQSVYVAATGDNGIVGGVAVFDRDPSTGTLTQLPSPAACVSETGTGGSCEDAVGVDRPWSLVVSPDGGNLYASSIGSDAVASFRRVDIAPCVGHGFSDVPGWVDLAVDWAVCGAYMDGFGDGTFRPDAPITRAQVARLLYRVNGSPDVSGLPAAPWSDIPDWIDDAARWLADGEYMTGYQNGTFRPNLPINRGQVTRVTYRLAGSPTGASAHPFTDVGNWLTEAVNWAAEDPDGAGPLQPIMTGYEGPTFRENLDMTRAQTTRLTCRANTAPGTC